MKWGGEGKKHKTAWPGGASHKKVLFTYGLVDPSFLWPTLHPQIHYLTDRPTRDHQYFPPNQMVRMVGIKLPCIIPLCQHLEFIVSFILYSNCFNVILLSSFLSEGLEAPRKLLFGKDEIQILESKWPLLTYAEYSQTGRQHQWLWYTTSFSW